MSHIFRLCFGHFGAHRNLDDDDLSKVAGTNNAAAPPRPNLVNFPSPSTEQILPQVDLKDIIKSCEDAKKGHQIDAGKVLNDMLGMMVHMFSKQTENDVMKTQVTSNTDRIDQLEAKVGDQNDVAYPRSIAIRRLPLPPHGVTEIQNAQHYLKEVKAQGVDISKDAIKAIRKESAKYNPNLGPNLGTVLVELRSEEIRGKIMKAKKNLETHPVETLKKLIIKNPLTPAEMKSQNTNFSLLKMITGGNDHFITGNGMILKKNPQQTQYQARQTQQDLRQNQQRRPAAPSQSHLPSTSHNAPAFQSFQQPVQNLRPYQQHSQPFPFAPQMPQFTHYPNFAQFFQPQQQPQQFSINIPHTQSKSSPNQAQDMSFDFSPNMNTQPSPSGFTDNSQ